MAWSAEFVGLGWLGAGVGAGAGSLGIGVELLLPIFAAQGLIESNPEAQVDFSTFLSPPDPEAILAPVCHADGNQLLVEKRLVCLLLATRRMAEVNPLACDANVEDGARKTTWSIRIEYDNEQGTPGFLIQELIMRQGVTSNMAEMNHGKVFVKRGRRSLKKL